MSLEGVGESFIGHILENPCQNEKGEGGGQISESANSRIAIVVFTNKRSQAKVSTVYFFYW